MKITQASQLELEMEVQEEAHHEQSPKIFLKKSPFFSRPSLASLGLPESPSGRPGRASEKKGDCEESPATLVERVGRLLEMWNFY